MGFFNTLDKPILYRESDALSKQIADLQKLLEEAPESSKKAIRQDLRLLQYGEMGEKTVRYELMNSFMPMLILEGLELEYEGLQAQIDFVVITRKITFVIECKNLYGDLELSPEGNFVRTVEFDGWRRKEGIYSPITQNQRHLDILKAIRKESMGNKFYKWMVNRYFEDYFKSVVVLANPKTVLSGGKAPRELRDQLIRSDQLIRHMKKVNDAYKEEISSDKQMYSLAEFLLSQHKPRERDHAARYGIIPNNTEPVEEPAEKDLEVSDVSMVSGQSVEEHPLYGVLKAYRLEKSREEGVKAYYIFNNAQLEVLLTKRPRTLEDLGKISGFGPVKLEKYGEDLLAILNQSL